MTHKWLIYQKKHHNLNSQLKAISATINIVKPLAYEESVT